MGVEIDYRAIVEKGAELGKDVVVGPYAIIGKKVKIGDNTYVGPGVIIKNRTTVGKGNSFFAYSSIGEIPQDLKYHGEDSELIIGDNNTFREFVTINIGTEGGGGVTRIGNNNLFMAYTHVAHDCIIGDNNVFSNLASLAGHIVVGNNVGFGGISGVHQFVHIGDYAYIGGGSMVTQDVVPFVVVAGNRADVQGINWVGIKRRNFSEEAREVIKQLYKIFFSSGLTVKEAIVRIKEELPDTPEVRLFVEFVENSSDRGFCRPKSNNSRTNGG